MRRRFGNALQFYSCLKDSTILSLDKIATSIRNPRTSPAPEDATSLDELQRSTDGQSEATENDKDGNEESVFTATPLTQRPLATPRKPQKRRRNESDSDESESDEPSDLDESPFPEPPDRDRPSDYLRTRCPCCFGGIFPREGLKG